MSKRQIVNELHKPARRHYPRRHVITKGLNDLFQADLVEMIPYAHENRGHKYLLTVIDVFSKYAWAIPIKNKSTMEVTLAMEKIFKSGHIPRNLHTDSGREFFSYQFKKLMEKYGNINHYSTYSNMKASIVERFNRTLKENMWKEFSFSGKYRWINILPDLLDQYNRKKHRTIGMSPTEALKKKNEKRLLNTVYNNIKISTGVRHAKFKIGDYVRISKIKHVFAKGYWPNFTTEIFKIKKVQFTNPVTYKLEDLQERPIEGGFYEQELQKTEHPNVYLIERVLRRKDNKIYVKWLGFDNTYNSWINKKDIVN